MEAQKVHSLTNFGNPAPDHDDAIAVEGLDDLFHWASEMVADGTDTRAKKSREQRLRRHVLEIITRNKEVEAQQKFSEEITYLQRRAMALLQLVSEKMEEICVLKQIMVAQHFSLQRIPELESEVKQLRSMTWYRDEAEAERKQLLTALAKLKKERDYLDELLQTNELENERLVELLGQARAEADGYRNRKWWHRLKAVFVAR